MVEVAAQAAAFVPWHCDPLVKPESVSPRAASVAHSRVRITGGLGPEAAFPRQDDQLAHRWAVDRNKLSKASQPYREFPKHERDQARSCREPAGMRLERADTLRWAALTSQQEGEDSTFVLGSQVDKQGRFLGQVRMPRGR